MLKDKLKDAIYSKDWGAVCDFYESMFGEIIEMPPSSPEHLDVESIKKKALSIIEECSLGSAALKSDGLAEPLTEPLPEPKEEDNSDVFTTGSVVNDSQEPKLQFISSDEFDLPEDEMEGYQEAVENSHKKRKKIYREEYKANMKICPGCNREFDFNKEYPAGLLESSREPKCNKCRAIPTN